MLQTVYLLLNASCTTFSSSVCVCVKQRGRGDRRRQEEVCSVFREPCFQTVTSDGGGGDEQMYFVHASDRCTRKLSPLSTLLTSEQALLCRSPLSRAPLSSLPRRSAASRPYGARRWDPHRRLQRRARDPIKKKPLCVLCSLKCKAYFIPYEPNSLQWLDALVVCCRWKTEVQRLGCVCFGIWLWSRCSSGRGPDGGGGSPRLSTEPCTCKLLVVSTKIRSEAIPS